MPAHVRVSRLYRTWGLNMKVPLQQKSLLQCAGSRSMCLNANMSGPAAFHLILVHSSWSSGSLLRSHRVDGILLFLNHFCDT